jgi:hypothetical protein
MPKNAESLNNNLFNLLRSRGYNPTLLGTDGKEIPVPDEAEVFQFQFVKDDTDYGPVTISIDGLHKLVVYFGDSVAKSPSEESHNEDTNWYSLLNHLKRFSQQHQLSFEVKNTDHLKYDMAKRNHMKKIDEAAKWRQGYSASGHPAGYKHKSGEVGPLGGTHTNEPSGYDGETKKVPVQKHRDKEDELSGRAATKLSTSGKPLLPKNAQRNLKGAIKQSKGKHGPVGVLPEGQLAEGYYATGKKSSYSDAIPQVKIILQHSRQLEEGERRYRAIDRIFVENANGERFLLDTKKPGLARVYARHIAEGGTPYDEQGKHIHSLVEEYTKMAGFVRATRNSQFNESTQSLVNEGVNHYNNLREQLHKMSGHRGYNAYFESWSPTLTEDEDTTDLSEMFASNELDPRIESVMPILRKLNKTISEMSETTELESWADSIIEGVDQLDEVSTELLSRYKKAAGQQASALNQQTDRDYEAGDPESMRSNIAKGNKRFSGIVKATNKQFANDAKDVEEGRFVKGPGGVPLDRQGNPIPPKVAEPKAPAGPRRDSNGLTKDDYNKVWRKIEEVVGNIFPDGDPIDWLAPWLKKSGIQDYHIGEVLDKACKLNGYKDIYEYYDSFKTADYGYDQSVAEGDGLEALNAEGIPESLDPEQKRVGQLGPQDKVGKKGAVGKLVGACESVDELDERDDREDDEHGGGPTPWENPDKGWVPPKVKHVKEGQEGLDAIKRLLGK